MFLPAALLSLCLLGSARAEITVYGQIPLGQQSTTVTDTSAAAAQTTAAAYNDTVLDPPPIPDPAPATAFTLELQSASSSVEGLSIPQRGNFYGFSIEMSVITQVMGKNSSFINVPFLNLLSNIVDRAGSVNLRLGGNTQEFATYEDDIPDNNGKALGKETLDSNNPTATPAVLYTIDLFYMMSNISSLLNVGWYLGIPFNDTNWRLQIAEYGEAILGDRLLGLQAGNEPDLYADHGHRDETYTPYDYFGEFGDLVAVLSTNEKITNKANLMGPSVASANWTPEQVWETNFIPSYSDSLSALTVEHYPSNNCNAQFGLGAAKDPQTEFPNYLNHTAGVALCSPYLNSATIAQAAGKPLLMFETNTASCGGFPGISDSYGAALWALDYGFQMAYSNFSAAMLHVGGQNVFYNPFTAPPTNQSSFNEWTIGAIYYSTLVVAEAFGKTNTSQILDLQGNDGSVFTPQYAIYENGNIAKVALFNYMTDPSGTNDYKATIHLNGAATPDKVYVKYLSSTSVSTKDNITWAGQTFGTKYTVDGRLRGDLDIVTIDCDQDANACTIPVPAPGFALVFFSEDLANGETPADPVTFATTAYTKTVNTATVDASVLATSNGHSGSDRVTFNGGSTSKGSTSGAVWLGDGRVVGTLVALSAMLWGGVAILEPFLR